MDESVTVVADDYGIPQDDKLMDWVFRESQKMKRQLEEDERRDRESLGRYVDSVWGKRTRR